VNKTHRLSNRMQRATFLFSILLAAALWLTACKTDQGPSNAPANTASPPSTASEPTNSNEQAAPRDVNANANSAPPAKATPNGPPTLTGLYEATEVRDKGVVTLMSSISTAFFFSPDGTYSRVSQADGKIYHRDSGQFKIIGPDKLKLTIQMADRKIQTPPIERTHTFSLSPDGEELQLTSNTGAVAVYRKAKKR